MSEVWRCDRCAEAFANEDLFEQHNKAIHTTHDRMGTEQPAYQQGQPGTPYGGAHHERGRERP